MRGHTVCKSLDAAGLHQLDAISRHVRFERHAALVEEGAPFTHVFNVVSGLIKTYKLLSDGRRQITGFLMPGDFLGLAGLDALPYTAEAVTDVEICRYPRGQFESVIRSHPEAERQMMDMAHRELAAAQDQMLLLGRKHADERVAWFILDLARRAEERGEPHSDRIELPISRADAADYLGLTVETVSRTFTRLRKQGLFDLPSPHTVLIRDRESLGELAGGEGG
ncbi:MAG: cyclic nucleotide-binding domain-containing protein [Acetobacterales bacterium]